MSYDDGVRIHNCSIHSCDIHHYVAVVALFACWTTNKHPMLSHIACSDIFAISTAPSRQRKALQNPLESSYQSTCSLVLVGLFQF